MLTSANGTKIAIADNQLFPRLAIVDPSLTYSLPARATAACGIDALCQGLESFWSLPANTESEGYAREAATLAYAHLERVVKNPEAQARHAMSLAALRSGQAIAMTGLTGCHGVSYGFSKYCGLTHGFAVAITLPWFLEFYASVQPEKCQQVCSFLGAESISQAQQNFRALLRAIGAPVTLSDAGCRAESWPEIIALGLPKRPASPRQLSAQDLQALLESLAIERPL